MAETEGIVVKQHPGHYYVRNEEGEWDCALSSRLWKQLEYPEASPGSRRRRVQRVRKSRAPDPVAIGDRVRIDPGDGESGMIHEVLPRRNKISRKAAGSSRREQVIAANIDRVIPVFAVSEPTPDWGLLDRMLGIAEWQEVPAAICINKMDLGGASARDIVEVYRQVGYRVVCTSTRTDEGKDEFRDLLSEGISLFVGPSGVGKSSLLNWLQPGLELRTGEVSQVMGDGRHTTTHLELVSLDEGGLVGDIPGVKEFHFWGIEVEDTPYLFREFADYLGECRFSDCSHVHEPKCAIRDAVDAGEVSRMRYDSYVAIREDR